MQSSPHKLFYCITYIRRDPALHITICLGASPLARATETQRKKLSRLCSLTVPWYIGVLRDYSNIYVEANLARRVITFFLVVCVFMERWPIFLTAKIAKEFQNKI